MKNLIEIFELAPFGLEKYAKIGKHVIYSNQKIIDKVKEQVEDDSEMRSISSIVSRGLDNRRILIGFVRSPLEILWRDLKSLLTYIDFFGIFRGGEVETVAFFSPADRRVVILLGPSVNIFGMEMRSIIPKITHELCHYTANQDENTFLSTTMRDLLLPFYRSLFSIVAPKTRDIPEEKLTDTIRRIVVLNERDVSNLKQTMSRTYLRWFNYLENVYKENEAKSIVNFLLLPYMKFIVGQLDKKFNKFAFDSLSQYYRAYHKAFGLNVLRITVPGQEFRLPSEVVAVHSELKLDTKIIKLINELPMKAIRKRKNA